jgi:2-deoxy-D-gluconate 3-dehydrogenase
MAVNVTGAFLCSQALAPVIMQCGGGTIVNVSSIYGVVGPDQRIYDSGDDMPAAVKPPDYSVTKAALLGLTKYLAAYYAGQRLTVNSLVIGGVQTDHDEGFVRRYSQRAPMGRMARRDEYSGALMYLLSDHASYMTGASLVVDGGWTAW